MHTGFGTLMTRPFGASLPVAPSIANVTILSDLSLAASRNRPAGVYGERARPSAQRGRALQKLQHAGRSVDAEHGDAVVPAVARVERIAVRRDVYRGA